MLYVVFYSNTILLSSQIFGIFLNYLFLVQIPLFDIGLIGLVGRVFANGQEDLGSILGRIIPKTLKMVLDTSLLNTQQYKVRIKG